MTESNDQHLIETRHGHLTVLTLNRPEALNAFSSSITSRLAEALPRLAADEDCRALMLTGAGRAFSAGGDVKSMASDGGGTESAKSADEPMRKASKAERAAGLRQSTSMVEWLHTMAKPTIAAIPGVVAGGGLSLALSCDIRIASTMARFTTAFNKLGLSGDYGGTYFLPHLVGASKARELYFTSEIIDAEEALRIGLVDRLFDNETFGDDALEYALRLSAMPPISTGLMKKNLNLALTGDLGAVLDLEAENMMTCFDSNDHQLGARAFVTKETPTFNGN